MTTDFRMSRRELEEAEKKCVHDEIHRLIKRAAEKACEDNGYGLEYLVHPDDLKQFFDKELRIEPAVGSNRELDRQFIHRQLDVNNLSSEDFQVPTANRTTLEETKKSSTSKQQGAAIKGGKESMQVDVSAQAKDERERESKVTAVTEEKNFLVPKGAHLAYKEFDKNEYKVMLARADKDFKFRVYFGHPVKKGALVGGGTGVFGGAAAGAGIGVAVGSIVPGIGNLLGAGVGAAIGVVAGITVGTAAGAGIGAGWRKEVLLSAKKVFSLYKEKDQDWKEEGKCIVYYVKYRYMHSKEEYVISNAK